MSNPPRTYGLGPFRLEIEDRAIYRGDRPVALTPRCFDVLRELVQASGRVVTKERLLERVWADAVVEEGSVTRTVSMLREALGAEGAALIETLPRVGYRIAGPVRPDPASPPALARIVWDERVFPLVPGENIVGRDLDAAVRLDVNSVSRHHARISLSEEAAILEDLGSKNGTFLGKVRLLRPSPLQDGDEISFGTASVLFRRPSSESTVTAKRS
jgi:DNA-binding winged helix-turn-helix (wHTH) protein